MISQTLTASPWLSDLLETQSPQTFEERCAKEPAFAADALRNIRAIHDGKNDGDATKLLDFLSAASVARTERISRRGAPWTDRDINEILSLALIDPARFMQGDPAFRASVLGHLPSAVSAEAAHGLRLCLLHTLARIPAIDAASLDRAAAGWKTQERTRESRHVADPGGVRPVDDGTTPIAATLFSMPSHFFERDECATFLEAVRKAHPNRQLLVYSDHAAPDVPAGSQFRQKLDALRIHAATTGIHKLSPWLRDPIFPCRDDSGRTVLATRRNVQAGRENDRMVASTLAAHSPSDFEGAVGELHHTTVPCHFHGGNVLLTPGAAWVSIHSLETRVNELLGAESTDYSRLGEPATYARYHAAAATARGELSAFLQRPVHFVHPWHETVPDMRHLADLAGGNDIDLDVLVAILPTADRLAAIVGDPAAGLREWASASESELADFARLYALNETGEKLRATITAYQSTPRAAAIGRFLETTAVHLRSLGIEVVRSPHLAIPARMSGHASGPNADATHAHFVIGFANAVPETAPDGTRSAECFASGLASLDRAASAAYLQAGYSLTLYPPLPASIVFEGGYRCLTQELRQRPAAIKTPAPR